MRITPVIGAILITPNNYRWVYIGNMQWRCIGNDITDNATGWKVEDIYTDDRHPIRISEGSKYITFSKYLKLCNIQESSATKKTS